MNDIQNLLGLSMQPVARAIANWWHAHAEQHYLMCADVEAQRVREANAAVAHYQKKAAMARSARLSN